MRPKILILGGYGTFGGRLAHLLADTETDILIAGRSLPKARAFCTGTRFTPLRLDRNDPLPAVDLVVDASGPFQAYGTDPHAFARRVLTSGAHYLDLSDGAEFTRTFPALDALARARGLFALSGASSFPCLTAAVLAEMGFPFTSVEAAILPSPHARVGRNVLRSVLSYCGAKVALPQGKALGLAGGRRFRVAPPGATPLPPTLATLVEVPDLSALPALFPGLENLWIGAGPRPEPLLRLLAALAPLRARGLLPDLAPLAPLAGWVLDRTRRGAHRGGMLIAAEGAGRRREWHMVAEGEDGPLIPSMAAEILIRHWLQGRPPAPGARSAAGEISLQDYRLAFARHRITEGFVEEVLPLPEPVRAFHAASGRWQGEARVRRHPLGRLVGLPPSGTWPLTVTTTRKGMVETWTRAFGPHRMTSTLTRDGERITERLGPFALTSEMATEGGALVLRPKVLRLGPLPLPIWLARVTTREAEEGGRYTFKVVLALPLVGEIARYEGWLA